MIEGNLKKGYELICDICGDTVEGLDDFDEAVEYKKENGWVSEISEDEWEDICPECQEG